MLVKTISCLLHDHCVEVPENGVVLFEEDFIAAHCFHRNVELVEDEHDLMFLNKLQRVFSQEFLELTSLIAAPLLLINGFRICD